MITGSRFDGDDNGQLMAVQHDAYDAMLLVLFSAARDKYLAAARLLRVQDDLTERLRKMDSFDHRTLQTAHDQIAAYFRFTWRDSQQLRLGESEAENNERLAAEWREFFRNEVANLAEDDEFTRAVCMATGMGNRPAGYSAEDWLERYLGDRYAARGFPVARRAG